MWIDGTGDYTSTSSDGSNLVMLFVLGGYIHGENIKDTSAVEQVNATEKAINFFIDRGQVIKRQVLDNLCPKAVTDLFNRRKMPFQLVPPNNHRYNRAEPAVGIWKNRWISMRAAIDPDYPLATEWHRLIPRVEIALNRTIPTLIIGKPCTPCNVGWDTQTANDQFASVHAEFTRLNDDIPTDVNVLYKVYDLILVEIPTYYKFC